MKKIVVLLLFSLFSCGEIPYDGETKLEISGKLVDKQGNPLSNIDVNINVIGNIDSYNSDLISFGKTNSEGKFIFLIPSPMVDLPIEIEIKNTAYTDKKILSKKNNFINYKLDLNEILLSKIDELTTFSIVLNQTNSNKQIKDVKIEGLLYENILNLNPINEETNYLITDYSIFKNQIITLKYKVIDYANNGSFENFQISIPINEDATEFIINY